MGLELLELPALMSSLWYVRDKVSVRNLFLLENKVKVDSAMVTVLCDPYSQFPCKDLTNHMSRHIMSVAKLRSGGKERHPLSPQIARHSFSSSLSCLQPPAAGG